MAAEDQDAQNWERLNPRADSWCDRETLAEFKRLMDADCLSLTVITGQDKSKDRDATHHLPRLLELAERGLHVLKAAEREGDAT